MPALNGLAAVRQILRTRPQTKILVFTVHDSDQTLKEIQAAGAHGYVSKSNASEDLLPVMKYSSDLGQSPLSSRRPLATDRRALRLLFHAPEMFAIHTNARLMSSIHGK